MPILLSPRVFILHSEPKAFPPLNCITLSTIELRSIKRLPFRDAARLCTLHPSCAAIPQLQVKNACISYKTQNQLRMRTNQASFASSRRIVRVPPSNLGLQPVCAEGGLQWLSSVTSQPHGEVVPEIRCHWVLPGFETRQAKRTALQNGSRALPVLLSVATGLHSPKARRLGRDVYCSLPFSADVKNEWR